MKLRDIAEQLYLGIDYAREKSRVMSNLMLMRAAYDVIGEQAAKGNRLGFRRPQKIPQDKAPRLLRTRRARHRCRRRPHRGP